MGCLRAQPATLHLVGVHLEPGSAFAGTYSYKTAVQLSGVHRQFVTERQVPHSPVVRAAAPARESASEGK